MYCLSSFCCVCLNDSVKLQDINQLDIDGLPLINKIIFVSFGHEAIDFKVVKYICLECTSILQLAYKFKRSCLVNHELLRIYSGQLKYFTGKVSKYEDLIVSLEKLPEKNEEDKTEVNNEEPTIVEKEETRTKHPIKTNVSPKKKKKKVVTLKCNVCDATFNRFVFLQMHYSTKHRSFFKVKKLTTKKNNNGTSYTCNICSNKLATLYSLTRHLQLHALRAILCKFCPARLETIETYKTHLISNHADRTALRCNICDLEVENDFLFRRHMFLKHSPRKCNHCEEILFSNSELLLHIHETHRAFKCDYCEKAFTVEKSLRAHLKIHETNITAEVIDEDPPEILQTKLDSIEKPPKKITTITTTKTTTNEKVAFQNVSLNSQLRKKCKNCLSVFSSSISLKKHKCFKLKNMFQCGKCDIIYSKKSSFTNHVKHCVFSLNSMENLANTPELQESEQSEQTDVNGINAVVNLIETNTENVLKNEDDLEIKEEILDDFMGTPQKKEKPIVIGEVYSISEFSDINNQDIPSQLQAATPIPKNKPKSNQKSPQQRKKTFPKIKLIEKDPNVVSSLKLRWKDLQIPIEELIETNKEIPTNTENTDKHSTEVGEISSSCDKLKKVHLRRKSALIDETETVFANTEQIQELSSNSSSDSAAAKFGNNQNVIDPLGFDVAPSKTQSENIFTVSVNPAEIVEKTLQKRRKNIWSGGVLNESGVSVHENANITEQSANIAVEGVNVGIESSKIIIESSNMISKRRKSIWTEDTPNENSNDSFSDKIDLPEKVCPKKGPARKRRKSIWLDDMVEFNDDNTRSSIVELEKPPTKKPRKSVAEATSNENSNESSSIDQIENPEKVATKKLQIRRKSIWAESTSNENSTDSNNSQEQSENKRRRRKSVWLESNEDSNDVTTTNPIRVRRKSTLIEDQSNISTTENKNNEAESVQINDASNSESQNEDTQKKVNLEPIILKTRRSIKHKIKARRKTICGFNLIPETQEHTVKPSDVNKNIANEEPTKLNSSCDVLTASNFLSANCSSIQAFKLRSLRRKSICVDGQMPINVDDDDGDDLNVGKTDTNYITVRKVSDINNDISGQPI